MYLLFILPLCGIVSVVVYRKLTSKPLDGILSRIPGPECSSWLKGASLFPQKEQFFPPFFLILPIRAIGNMLELFNRQHGPQYHLNLVKNYDRVARVQGFLGVRLIFFGHSR